MDLGVVEVNIASDMTKHHLLQRNRATFQRAMLVEIIVRYTPCPEKNGPPKHVEITV